MSSTFSHKTQNTKHKATKQDLTSDIVVLAWVCLSNEMQQKAMMPMARVVQRLLLMVMLPCFFIVTCAYARSDGYLRQSACASERDCGFGIWNPNTCECNCISPYCFNEFYQSCATVSFVFLFYYCVSQMCYLFILNPIHYKIISHNIINSKGLAKTHLKAVPHMSTVHTITILLGHAIAHRTFIQVSSQCFGLPCRVVRLIFQQLYQTV